jgi:CheY-like chemotaxis protein
VDDAPDMRFLARHILESAGIHVVGEAADGHEAIEKFRELAPPPIPTVILLDNQMPKLSGVEAAAQILAEAPDQMIVLFSAYLSNDILDEAKRLGVRACVSKIDVKNLPEIIMSLVEASAD